MALSSIFKKQKKANVWLDSFFVFLTLIVFGLVSITGSYILSQINSDAQVDPDLDDQSKFILQDLDSNLPTWFDYGIAAVLILMWLMVIVSSLFIDSHPVFFIIGVIFLMVIIFAINQSMDAVDDFTTDSDIAPTMVNFPITQFIFSNIESLIVVIGFSIILAIYFKYRA